MLHAIFEKAKSGRFAKSAAYLSIFVSLAAALFGIALASTNIVAVPTANHWAWSDFIGWIDFYNTQTITVSSQNLTGYASSSAGYVALDCHTAPNGNDCADHGGADYQVTNDGVGDLSGYGWNDTYGWISFDCHNNNGCGASTYEAKVDPTTGEFSGYAWNDTIGWICFASSTCGGQQSFEVKTTWIATSTYGTLDSTTFDTGALGGAQINSILWQGDEPAGTQVSFQIAVSNTSGGPWTFVGPDNTGNTYYGPVAPNTSQSVDYAFHNNMRYFRYRVVLYSNQAQTKTPRVDDVSINWSP